MVLKQTCTYSGRQILPGYGKRYAKNDKSLHVFLSSKCANHYKHKWSARRIAWTLINRRSRGKDVIVYTKQTTTTKAVVSTRNYGSLNQTKLEELRKKFAAELKK